MVAVAYVPLPTCGISTIRRSEIEGAKTAGAIGSRFIADDAGRWCDCTCLGGCPGVPKLKRDPVVDPCSGLQFRLSAGNGAPSQCSDHVRSQARFATQLDPSPRLRVCIAVLELSILEVGILDRQSGTIFGFDLQCSRRSAISSSSALVVCPLTIPWTSKIINGLSLLTSCCSICSNF